MLDQYSPSALNAVVAGVLVASKPILAYGYEFVNLEGIRMRRWQVVGDTAMSLYRLAYPARMASAFRRPRKGLRLWEFVRRGLFAIGAASFASWPW